MIPEDFNRTKNSVIVGSFLVVSALISIVDIFHLYMVGLTG